MFVINPRTIDGCERYPFPNHRGSMLEICNVHIMFEVQH